MIRDIVILFNGFVSVFLLSSCTFGSVGDARKEEAKALQRLLTLFNERPSSFMTNLYYTDDQQDANIGGFDVASGINIYTLQLQAGSEIVWDAITIRVNPNLVPIIPGQTKTIDKGGHSAQSHTPYTVPLDLPIASPYGQEYGTASFTDRNVDAVTGNILTGDVHTSLVPQIQGVPAGYLASVKYKIQSLDLTFQISRTAPTAITRNVRIQMPPFMVEIFPRCRFDINPEVSGSFPINWKFNGLLQDQSSTSILDSIAVLADPVDINPYQNQNLYDLILKNINQQDRVLFPTGCNLF
ncbi:hypothetical protein AB3N59_11840 [Leptospira sp. WS92.C1]